MPAYQPAFAKFLSRAVPLAALAMWATACSSGSQVPADVANVTTCSVAPATVATWFKSGSVTLDGEVTPADSIGFTNNPNCDFYVWSERMFLWLTSPTPPSYGGGGGRIFASPAFFDVSPEGPGHVRTLIAHKVGLPTKLSLREAQKGPHELPLVQDKRSGRLFELAPTPLSERKLQMIRNTADQLVEIQRAELNGNGPPTLFDPQGKKIDFLRPREKNVNPQGATWRPGGALTGPGVGTSQLANTTMETFAQSLNCFGCHNGLPLGDSSGNGHSHIFGQIAPLP